MRRIVIAIAAAVLVSGCAVGVKHDYNIANVELTTQTTESIAVAVHDQRPYIVSGKKTEDFVGLSRGGFGNPFDVTTKSGMPLAKDMAETIVANFQKKGIDAKEVWVVPTDDEQTALETLIAANKSRSILITLREWKADTYAATRLIYDIAVKVFSGSGEELARHDLLGEDDLGSGGIDTPAHSRKVIPIAFKEKMEALFGDPGVRAALP
jgi:ABC-type glycerol-3-phosphate transport system substrate-binding protein